MPRIYDYRSEAHDFCKGCMPTEKAAREMYDHTRKYGDQSEFAYNDVHPPYEDTDYECEKCGRQLRVQDN